MSKLRRLALTLGAGILVLCSVSMASAQVCSDRSLKGNFGYTVTGTIVEAVGPLIQGPFVAVGKITFDGRGGVKTVRSLNDNGLVLQKDMGTGTYKLNEDCTGSFTISVGPPTNPFILTLDIVLDDTDQLRGVVTTPGAVLAFEGRRQFPIYF